MPCSLTSKVSSASVPSAVAAAPVVSVTKCSSLCGSVYRRAGGSSRELLGDLGDLERLGLLGLVRVLRSGVHLELAQHLTAEPVLREHPPPDLLDGPPWVLLQQLAEGRGRQTARVAGVPVGHLLGRLVPGERHLARVHDDDEVAAVDVRGERGLVLAAQQGRDLHGEASEHHVRGVDDVPLALDVSGLWAVRTHVHLLSRLLSTAWARPTGEDRLRLHGPGTARRVRADVRRGGQHTLETARRQPRPPEFTLAW